MHRADWTRLSLSAQVSDGSTVTILPGRRYRLQTVDRPRAPRAAFGNMVLNEARLAWRQPAGIIAGIGIALLLLVIFGEIPVFQQPSASLGGYSAFDIYIPILMCFSIALIAFTYLPGPLVS